MTHQRIASSVRRLGSSLCFLCALAALVWLVRTPVSICHAQDLQLQPTDDGDDDQDDTTPAEELAEEQIPDPGAALKNRSNRLSNRPRRRPSHPRRKAR